MGKLFLGSDKSGFRLKEAIREYLVESNIDFEDIGTLDEEKALPFFEVAEKGAKALQKKVYDRGILICGTGMGMSIVANKHFGVIAAACESVYAAEKCRAINDANVLCMGGWLIGPVMGLEMAKAFLNTSFTQNLEDWRARNLEKARTAVREIEKNSFSK
ncbi:MAG: RpiB/LacA/LacB family sugar-phosphate isomerase [Tenericutes bacterium]|nr:RpiB/LacA/LacB family sugar-phosphate isomerase [Mycoplasmatota bacterium]